MKSYDLELAVLCALLKPGERLTAQDIAAVCGISHNMVYLIEREALRKLRAAYRAKLLTD